MPAIVTPNEALAAIDCLAEEAAELAADLDDLPSLSWAKAVKIALGLRAKWLEARAVVAEAGIVLPPGPLTSAAVAIVRDELRRVDSLAGWTEEVSEMPVPPHVAQAMKKAAQKKE